MGSGLIYAMVIGLWALVLLPTWLRNHEQDDEGKQVDRFRRAMSQLSTGMEILADTEHKQVQAKRVVRAGAVAPVRLSAAARRRRVLAVLSTVLLVMLLASLLGAPMWLMAVPAAAIVAFLGLARSQVRAEEARRHPAAPQLPARAHTPSTFARTLAAARAALRANPAAAVDVVEQAPAAPTVDAPAAWQPVRTPAPAYVSAPAATAVPRAIDADGGWTGSAMVAAARAMAEQAPEMEPVVETAAAPVAMVDDVTAEIPVIRSA